MPISRGTLDVLLEAGWIRLRGRRRTPGRPVTFGTTPNFLDHFDLERIGDLPGLSDLKAAGLLEAALPAGMEAGIPDDDPDLADDEDPLEPGFDEFGSHDEDAGRTTPRQTSSSRSRATTANDRSPTSGTEPPCRLRRRVP